MARCLGAGLVLGAALVAGRATVGYADHDQPDVVQTCTAEAVKINELNPEGDPEDWVELINVGRTPCNLKGWKLYSGTDHSAGDSNSTLTFDDAIIASRGIWLGCANTAAAQLELYGACELADLNRTLPSSLNAVNDTVYLRHPLSDHLDAHSVYYDRASGESGGSVQSLQRCGDSNYVWSNKGSPGRPNVCPMNCSPDAPANSSQSYADGEEFGLGWRSEEMRDGMGVPHMAMARNECESCSSDGEVHGNLTVDDLIVVDEERGSTRSVRDWLAERTVDVARIEGILSTPLAANSFNQKFDYTSLTTLPSDDSRRPLWLDADGTFVADALQLEPGSTDLLWPFEEGNGIEAPSSTMWQLNISQSDASLCDSTHYRPTLLMGQQDQAYIEDGYSPIKMQVEGAIAPNSSLGITFDIFDTDNFFHFDTRLDGDGKKICQVVTMHRNGISSIVGKVAYKLDQTISLAHTKVTVRMHGDTARIELNLDRSSLVLEGDSDWYENGTVADLGILEHGSLEGRLGTPYATVPLKMSDWRGTDRLPAPTFTTTYYASGEKSVSNGASVPMVYELDNDFGQLLR